MGNQAVLRRVDRPGGRLVGIDLLSPAVLTRRVGGERGGDWNI